MRNIYKTNFEQIKNAYKNIFDALERALKLFDVDFYLIGAKSRDVWINHLDLNIRTTRDIDYSVFVKDRETWNQLTEYLINSEGFERDKKEPYRFYLGEIVDLIPFGGLEENGEVVLDNPSTEISVFGCKEVTEEAIIMEGGYKVISLPGLCILKLIAWDEKPGIRNKDLEDFLFIMNNYSEIAGELLYEGTYDDLIEGDFEMAVASARMLGRHMKPLLNKNLSLNTNITKILRTQLKGFEQKEIDEMYQFKEFNDKLVINMKLISEILKGIKD